MARVKHSKKMKSRERGDGGFVPAQYEAFFFRCRGRNPKKCGRGSQWGSVAKITFKVAIITVTQWHL